MIDAVNTNGTWQVIADGEVLSEATNELDAWRIAACDLLKELTEIETDECS